MNEIEKLYENAGIEKLSVCEYTCMNATNCNVNCVHYNDKTTYYPPFTAEKQLQIEGVIFRHNFGICELERFLGTEFDNRKFIKHYFVWHYIAQEDFDDEYIEYQNEDRTIALAGFINSLWQDLTEEEKEQIREILK